MNAEKAIIAVLVIAGAGLLVWSVGNAVSQKRVAAVVSPERYAAAVARELPDKCATPSGYTDESWFEHMSHHPDRYQECFDAQGQSPLLIRDIDPRDLAVVMERSDITLIDTHIPEQAHIPGTDAVIPYNEIAQRLSELPQDKTAPIVLYCRSGNMSVEAAKQLFALGYTNVYNLAGGTNAWTAAGYALEEGAQ